MKKTNTNKNQDPLKPLRGLAAADQETRLRVAQSGGRAEHYSRGLQASDEETRKRVATMGGNSSWKKRKEGKRIKNV